MYEEILLRGVGFSVAMLACTILSVALIAVAVICKAKQKKLKILLNGVKEEAFKKNASVSKRVKGVGNAVWYARERGRMLVIKRIVVLSLIDIGVFCLLWWAEPFVFTV